MTTYREANAKYLRISSADKKPSQTNTDFEYDTTDTDINHVKKFSVHTISVPNSFHNITLDNQNFQFSVGSFPFIVNTITVPIGFYNIGSLITTLQTLITPFLGGPLTITQNSITGILTFTSASDTMKFFNNDLGTSPLSPYIGIMNTSGGFSLVIDSTAPPSLQGETIVFFHSSEIAPGQTRISENILTNCFATVCITKPYGNTQDYQPEINNNTVYFTNSMNFSSGHIRLRGQGGRLLSLPENQYVHIILKCHY